MLDEGVRRRQNRAQPRRVGVLGQVVGKLINGSAANAATAAQLLDRRSTAHPHLAVSGVGIELGGVSGRPRLEVQGGVVAVVGRIEHQHGVWFLIGTQAGQVGERRMGPKAVVRVVGPHLEPAGGNDQPIPGELVADGLPAPSGVRGGGQLIRKLRLIRGPALLDELLERIGERHLAVGQRRLLITHTCILPPSRRRGCGSPQRTGSLPAPSQRWAGTERPARWNGGTRVRDQAVAELAASSRRLPRRINVAARPVVATTIAAIGTGVPLANAPTTGAIAPPITNCAAPSSAAAVPASSPCRLRAMAGALGNDRPQQDMTNHRGIMTPSKPPNPVTAVASRVRALRNASTTPAVSTRTGL